jgi:hypothetical protein
VDYSVIPIYLVLSVLVFGYFFRANLRAWWIRRKLKSAGIAGGAVEPPALTSRLYELEKVFGPFGSSAAHPSALYAQRQFTEAADLLAAPEVPLAVVLQYVEGNSWSLASAALAALRKRPDRGEVVERVLTQCENFSPWAMYFALELLFESVDAEHIPRLSCTRRGARRCRNLRADAFCCGGFAARHHPEIPSARHASLCGNAHKRNRRRAAADGGVADGGEQRDVERGRPLLEKRAGARSPRRAGWVASGVRARRIDAAAKSAALAARLR